MSKITRRKLITTGLATAAGATGLGVAAKLAARYGLIPPDAGTLYGAGDTLTYAAQRIITRHTMAREFSRSEISKAPFADPVRGIGEEFERLQHGGFADWRLTVDGLVARRKSFTLDELKSLPATNQITFIACEEGWSYIAEWSGVRLSHVLDLVGTHPQARYVVYTSVQPDWWDSMDMADALHPQTILTLGMNGAELPVPFGGPLRMRVPRQIGYKSVKYITRLTVTDDIRKFGKGLGSAEPEFGYSWYAGI
jgi:DMSO/TMAO reductase YedYZ molybdopterin-dependent catalytic subunit